MTKLWLTAIVLCGAWLAVVFPAAAQDIEDPAVVPAEAEAKPADPLLTRQQQLADRFQELERLMLRMAELTAPTDPRRAALLRQAVAQSKERAIDQRYETLVELLKQDKLSAAVRGQGEIQQDLAKLLELLLSEDRSKRIESEKERVRDYLKRVNKIIKEQKSVQNATERDADTKELAERQNELSDKTGELADDLRAENGGDQQPAGEQDSEGKESEGEESEGKDGKPEGEKQDGDKQGSESEKESKPGEDAEGKPGEKSDKPGEDADGEKSEAKESDKESKPGEPSDGEKSEGKDADGKPSEGESEKSESKPGENSEGQPQSGKPQDGAPPVDPPPPGQQQPGEPSPQSEQNPAQQRLEKAQQRMEEAQKKLAEAQREDAVEKQEEALRELEQAKAELEEILRQLREEEMARTLAMLEARFRKMLDAQVEVYEGTQRLDKVPEAERDRDDAIEAGRLSRKEGEIAAEAEKALTVLQEEGSAVAFPEAVIEIRDDMWVVRDRLAEAKIGEMTQGIEQDIITALEEMISALEKAQKDMQEQQQQGQPMQAGGENETPLVDTLSELKMIRALQMRVNTRTKRYAELTKTEQVDEPELLEALRRLAEREQRIHKVTRDIVLGRNR